MIFKRVFISEVWGLNNAEGGLNAGRTVELCWYQAVSDGGRGEGRWKMASLSDHTGRDAALNMNDQLHKSAGWSFFSTFCF